MAINIRLALNIFKVIDGNGLFHLAYMHHMQQTCSLLINFRWYNWRHYIRPNRSSAVKELLLYYFMPHNSTVTYTWDQFRSGEEGGHKPLLIILSSQNCLLS